MQNLYYTNPSFVVGNKEYHTYMCLGQRGRGKTTYWLATLLQRAIMNIIEYKEGKVLRVTKKFIYLRRKDEDLKSALEKGIFNGVFNCGAYDKVTQMANRNIGYNKGEFFYTDTDGNQIKVGYYSDLNRIKGISVEDADTLLFDEIVEIKRSDYKGGNNGVNEPNLLARLDETLFRSRENWHIYLGNFDQPTNPYSENFHIPYGTNKFTDKERGFIYEVDISEATTEHKHNSSTGQRWINTEYDRYSNGEISLQSIGEDFICEKPKHSELIYNVKVAGNILTMWRDKNTGIVYIQDNCKINPNFPIFSVLESDMSLNSNFVSFNRQFIQYCKNMFSIGYLRFNNQKSYSLFTIIIGL